MHDRLHPRVDVGDWLQLMYQTTHLVGREIAKAWREDVESHLSQVAVGSVLTIDFTGVDHLDFTAADEGMVKLIRRVNANEYGEIALALVGLGAMQEENLVVALSLARLAVIVQRKDGPEVIGYFESYIHEVLRYLWKEKAITARAWADVTDEEINLASTKLLKLHKLRLLLRNTERLPDGGRQYIYRPVEGQLVSAR